MNGVGSRWYIFFCNNDCNSLKWNCHKCLLPFILHSIVHKYLKQVTCGHFPNYSLPFCYVTQYFRICMTVKTWTRKIAQLFSQFFVWQNVIAKATPVCKSIINQGQFKTKCLQCRRRFFSNQLSSGISPSSVEIKGKEGRKKVTKAISSFVPTTMAFSLFLLMALYEMMVVTSVKNDKKQ